MWVNKSVIYNQIKLLDKKYKKQKEEKQKEKTMQEIKKWINFTYIQIIKSRYYLITFVTIKNRKVVCDLILNVIKIKTIYKN